MRRADPPAGGWGADGGADEARVEGVDARDIYRARNRLANVARHTPLTRADWLSREVGIEVHLKLECWQRTHSFKLRGAVNAVGALRPDQRRHGLVTASAGNHGQALALAARQYATTATVFVPSDAPATKKARIRAYGASLREVEGGYDDAAREAVAFADRTGATYVHAFSDPAVVAGQGTVGLEIVEDLPGVRTVVVPVGGGGLAAGVGVALRALTGGRTALLGVQSTATRAMHAAFEAGRVVPTPLVPTLCDGLAGDVEDRSYRAARSVLRSMHLVEEAAVAPAIRALYDKEGVVAEGSGAVGVAAALTGALPLEDPTVIVVSGGNLDMKTLARILAGD